MTQDTVINVPDLGDFPEVEIIEILVSPGDTVAVSYTHLTLPTTPYV